MSNVEDPHSVSQSLEKAAEDQFVQEENRELEEGDENAECQRAAHDFQLLVDRSQQLFAGLR